MDFTFLTDVDLPSKLGLDYEDITLTTSDHVNIKAYLITHSAPELDIKCSLDFSVCRTPISFRM